MAQEIICKRCSLYKHPNIEGEIRPLVPGSGGTNPDIFIVLDKPTDSDQQFLKPTTGQRGKVLTTALGKAGIDLSRCYFTHVLKHSLPYKKSVTKKQLTACAPLLDWELNHLKPKVVIAMGADAIAHFTGDKSVNSQRGKAIKLPDFDLIATFSPGSFTFSKDNKYQHFLNDLKTARNFADGVNDYDETEIIKVRTLNDLKPFISSLENSDFFSWDLETNSLCGRCCEITDIGLCSEEGKAYVLQVQYWDELRDKFKPLAASETLQAVYDLIRNAEHMKTTHGGCYDYTVLYSKKIITMPQIQSGWWWDSLYLHHACIDNRRPHVLEYLAANDTTMSSWDAGKSAAYELHGRGAVWRMDPDDRARYCGGDVDATFRLTTSYIEQARKTGTLSFYETISRPMLPVIVEIMSNGMKVDYPQLQKVRMHYERQKRMLDRQIRKKLKITDKDFNIGSPDQMVPLIEKVTRIKWPKEKWFYTDTNKRGKASKEVRNAMSGMFPHKIWGMWGDYIKINKLLSTYLDKDQNRYTTHGTSASPRSITAKMCPITNRVHTSLKPHGTDTYRRSSSDPNLQNISKRNEDDSVVDAILVRTVFVPSRSYRVLVQCDYETAEVWTAAYLSEDPAMVKVIEDGLDMHSITASSIFGYKNYEEFLAIITEGKRLEGLGLPVPKNIELALSQRNKAKVVNFGGILYGGGPRKIGNDIGVSTNVAKKLLEQVEVVYTRFYEWRREQVERARRLGYTETAYGFRRHVEYPENGTFFEKITFERVAFNTPIQGTVACHVAVALPRVMKALTDGGFDGAVIHEMHDEIITEIKESQAEEWLKVMLEAMTFNVPGINKSLPVSGEIKKRWKELG